ncbi:MAG: hypothetical protein Q7R81_00750 [Candidatus Peregrinibacteria bacterium]|nr:hypothetical protein [Candidatus Peregrinibacteria bacterium]
MNTRPTSYGIILLLLALSACGGDADRPNEETPTEGTPPAVESPTLPGGALRENRPSAALGVYVSTFMSRGLHTPIATAVEGTTAVLKLSPLAVTEDDLEQTFSLLQEFGAILQVNVIDLLNRSTDRPKTLNDYTANLQAVGTRSKQHTVELETRLDILEPKLREERRTVNDLQRTLNTAVRDQDYALAGALQRDLLEAQTAFTKSDSLNNRIEDLIDAFEDLLEIGERRLKAIEVNREVLIAGLSVENVPGLEDLGVIREPERNRDRNEPSPFGEPQ